MWTTTYPINLILSNESRFVKCFCLVFFVATIEVGFVDDTQLKRGFHESKSKDEVTQISSWKKKIFYLVPIAVNCCGSFSSFPQLLRFLRLRFRSAFPVRLRFPCSLGRFPSRLLFCCCCCCCLPSFHFAPALMDLNESSQNSANVEVMESKIWFHCEREIS